MPARVQQEAIRAAYLLELQSCEYIGNCRYDQRAHTAASDVKPAWTQSLAS
jgi:hypothetical protein